MYSSYTVQAASTMDVGMVIDCAVIAVLIVVIYHIRHIILGVVEVVFKIVGPIISFVVMVGIVLFTIVAIEENNRRRQDLMSFSLFSSIFFGTPPPLMVRLF